MDVPANQQVTSLRLATGPGVAVALYGLFLMTGVGTALLGSTLPVMLVHWRLTDASAGALFLLLFVGSSAGSLASRASCLRRVGWVGVLLAATCVALGLSRGGLVFAFTTIYGFLLGMGISTVTRVRVRYASATRVMEVNRLNLAWGLGAFLCPTLANVLLRHWDVRTLFFTLAGAFAACAGATFAAAGSKQVRSIQVHEAERGWRVRLPWLAAVGAFLSVGLESSLGGWLATYTKRLEGGFAAPVEVTTLFWLGLLASRAACSTNILRNIPERRLLLGCIAISWVGCSVLVSGQGGKVVMGGALLTGFGVGPLFPLLLAAVLPRVRGNLIFVAAGIGSAVLPWMTGMVSWRAGSLRLGLMVPAMAALLMLAIGPRLGTTLESLVRSRGYQEGL